MRMPCAGSQGKLVAICDRQDAARLLETMRADPNGKDAAIIGEITADEHRFVQIETVFGGKRILDWLVGEALPRIC